MIYFCYFCPKNFFSTLGVAHDDPFSVQIGSKKTIFERFYQLFFRTPGLQHKLLIWIVSPNIFHWKSARKSKVGVVFGVQCCKKKQRNWYFNGVFFIFCMRYSYIYKQKVPSGYRNTWVEIEQKNTTHFIIWRKLGQKFWPFWVRNSKKWLFEEFLL